eukprot:TRINITY_DN12620_c0_g2_i1.p1 TRINITY_DN12620_c0_g2~~TRINITY_DN12620_c0_g2_i1.p1  ORF type:complete len:311 (+),score=37.49 TRINITY_DN12620_c0_g2_i1:869-1801(+)
MWEDLMTPSRPNCASFSPSSLEIVDLSIILPSQFKDLTNLQTLSLSRVRITNSQLESLVSHCPNLGDLYLSHCGDVWDLRIRAPNLWSLNISLDKPMCFSLIIAPCLNRVFLNYSSGDEAEEQEDDHGEKAEAVNLVKSLMNLSHIKCFRFICDAKLFKLPYNLPTGHQFVHLKELSMILNFLDAEMVSLLLFLLRSCPNLQELALEGTCLNEHIPIEIDFWEKQRPPDCFINPLLRVYMHEISLSSKSVIGFVKFLLLNAHVLIGMTLDYIETPEHQLKDKVIINDLLRLKRASPQVLLDIKPYWNVTI